VLWQSVWIPERGRTNAWKQSMVVGDSHHARVDRNHAGHRRVYSVYLEPFLQHSRLPAEFEPISYAIGWALDYPEAAPLAYVSLWLAFTRQ